jgi:acetyl esterase/lipase
MMSLSPMNKITACILLLPLCAGALSAAEPTNNAALLAQHEKAEGAAVEASEEIGAKAAYVPAYPANERVEADVAYLEAGRPEKCDLYFPKDIPPGAKLPAVVVIHGGGFNDGDKARKREINFCSNLTSQGYVCMSINYKLRRTQGQVTWPQALYDAKTAVRWLRQNAARLQVDPDRIGAMGGSAGGNLAMMLALTRPGDGLDPKGPYGDVSAAVSCAADFYGAVNLMEYHDMKMFAKTRAEAPALYAQASPIHYVRSNVPPLLIVHGTADDTVPLSQSEGLVNALRQAGAKPEFIIVDGAPHTFDLQPRQRDLRSPVFDFFNHNLKPGGGASPAASPNNVSAAGGAEPPQDGGTGEPTVEPRKVKIATIPPDVRTELDVPYLGPDRAEKADLYLPAPDPLGQLRPAVVLIHGGGWREGDKRQLREVNIGTNLVLHGYVAMSINYLLCTNSQATWPQNLQDCKAAIRWLRKNAARYQIDPDRIGVLGGSAGGHLAAMVALTTPADGFEPDAGAGAVSSAVRCCVDFYGIADLPSYHNVAMLGKTFAEAPELYRRASPVNYVRSNAPPFLIVAGTADKTVNPEQSQLLADTLSKARVANELRLIPGAVHTFHLQPPQADLRPLVMGFLDKYLKSPAPAELSRAR